MALLSILSYIRTAPKEEIEIYNKIVEIGKNNIMYKDDPSNPDDYKILQNILIQKNSIWDDIINGKYGFFDKINIKILEF